MRKQNKDIIGIYKITNPKGEVYIGQTVNFYQRKKYYQSTMGKGQPKINLSIKYYGWDKHKFEVIEICKVCDLDFKEEYHKTTFVENVGWEKALFCRLKDGRGGFDSEETKKKKSLASKGKPKSNSHKLNMKKPRSLSFKEKMKNRNFHWNNKLRNSIISSKSKPILQLSLDGRIIKEWSTIAEPMKKGFGDVDGALRGRQKTAGGYIWKFK